jgi:hypothetical protein
MNDDELITVLREQRGKVPMTTPVEQIISRGRAVRARRRVPGVAAALGAAAAVAVSVALPASHPAASHPASGPGAHLAAWAVTRQADGSIQVSFFGQLRDPAGLQRTLRADGVPASVTFIGQQNPACRVIQGGGRPPSLRGARPLEPSSGAPGPSRGTLNSGMLNGVVSGGPQSGIPAEDAMVIHPAALPSGAGLQIAVMRGIPLGPSGPWPYPKGSGHPVVEVGLVKASPQCTGS